MEERVRKGERAKGIKKLQGRGKMGGMEETEKKGWEKVLRDTISVEM